MWYTKLDQVPTNKMILSRDKKYQDTIIKEFQSSSSLPTSNIHAYEVIQSNKPRRFYLDLDLKDTSEYFTTFQSTRAMVEYILLALKINFPHLNMNNPIIS
jgi:hypothetical protein